MNKPLNQLNFENSFSKLPNIFFTRHKTSPLKNQHIVHFNQQLAEQINLEVNPENIDQFINQITDEQSINGFDALAQCYAGHQFGHFVPRLGDGRALLMGEIITDKNEHWDIQLKGAGKTEYSRGGDGRAVLRSSIREYLCSEAMYGLGIPTTQSLCLIGSDEEVYREQIEKGAILVRMAKSHIRFGSFEYYYYSNKHEELKILADYVLEQYFPLLNKESNPYLALLNNVIQSTAALVANWQSVGFCHGVLNTDNMSIHGLTLDYGPFGFLDEYDKKMICNHSDHEGRYAYEKQPEIGLFNLSCFAQTLLPLLNENAEQAAKIAIKALEKYQQIYAQEYAEHMRDKLGFVSSKKIDQEICNEILELMQKDKVDFTIFFRSLSQINQQSVENLFEDKENYNQWFIKYTNRLKEDEQTNEQRSTRQKKKNPKYILRNYLAEQAIQAANKGDYSEIDRLYRVLKNPFEEQIENEHYANPIPMWAKDISVSCSS